MTERAHEGGPELDCPPRPPRPQKPPPRTVALVCCGPTNSDWHAGNFTYERQFPTCDEVWILNKGLRTMRGDLVFILDDLVGEARRSPEYANDIRKITQPIITSTVDDEVRRLFPCNDLHEYPIVQVLYTLAHWTLRARGHSDEVIFKQPAIVRKTAMENWYYLHNSVPMILAYAAVIGVKGVQLFGADYTFPGMSAREDDRANAEYWVGALRAFGVEVRVTSSTTLLNTRQGTRIYGYGARPPVIPKLDSEQLRELVCR